MHRRNFLSLFPASLMMSAFPNSSTAAGHKDGRFCVIILEGGMDGIAAIPPIGDPNLDRWRRHLGIKEGTPINNFFGIHPSLKQFTGMLLNNEAAVVHAASFPYTKRSHFEGQNIAESGVITPFSSDSGWLGRAMDLLDLSGRALSLDTPLIIRGKQSVANYFPAMIDGSRSPTLELMEHLKRVHEGDYLESTQTLLKQISVSNDAYKPRDPTDLAYYAGTQMQSSKGPKLAVIRVNEFDTHARQGADDGAHASQLSVVDSVFGALKSGLGPQWSNTVVMTITEFGRTVGVNGADGTDHGYGTASLIAGGLINQSAIIADWPGLSGKGLFEDRDLLATIDMRSVCAACLNASFALPHDQIASEVFFDPGISNLSKEIFA